MAADLSATPQGKVEESQCLPHPGARLALMLLLAINLFNYLDRYVLAAVESAISLDFLPGDPKPEEKMGMLMPAFMFTYMLLAPLFGWLADRMSRWLLIGVGVILWSLASGASGLAAGFTMLFVTRCFVGIGEAAYGPAAPTIISDLYPVRIRGYVLSWFYMAIPVGSALGFGLGGLMLSLTGDWRWAFYAVVPPGLLLGICCLFMPNPQRGHSDRVVQTRVSRWRDYLTLLKTPSFVLDTAGMAAMTFAVGGIAFFMPRYIVNDKGHLNLGTVNLIFSAILAVSSLGATISGGLLGDWLRCRYPGSYFLVSGAGMIVGFPLVLLILFTPFPLAWLFVFLAIFCLFFNTGPTNTILANVTHPAVRASAFALNILIIHALGDAISPPIIGAIASRSNLTVGFMVVSGFILASGLLWLWGARYLERDTALAPTRLD
jgi:MFS family permease